VSKVEQLDSKNTNFPMVCSSGFLLEGERRNRGEVACWDWLDIPKEAAGMERKKEEKSPSEKSSNLWPAAEEGTKICGRILKID